MDLKDYAAKAKTLVQEFLATKNYENTIPGIIEDITTYATAGKGVRGGLILAQHDLYNGSRKDEAEAAAIAAELFHSAILMIDDIIDCDDLRRGLPTMHVNLATLDPHRTFDKKRGESFAMCVGLITTYLAQELLAKITVPEVISRMSEGYVMTGFAEMQELLNDTNPDTTADDIFDVYVYKTGKYTISMPAIVGALLADAPEEDIALLDKIGVEAGVLFQLKDDMLEIEGTTETIGKSIASDIKMNNKTFPRIILENNCTKEELQKMASIYGAQPTDEEVTFIQDLHKKYNTKSHIEEVATTYIESALQKITRLSIDNTHLKFLLKYNEERAK